MCRGGLERYETTWEESSNERIGKKFGGITWLDHFMVKKKKLERTQICWRELKYVGIEK